MAAILAPTASSSQETSKSPYVVVRDWLVIAPVDAGGRRPIRCNAVFARHLLARDSKPPSAGDVLSGELGKEAAWERSQAKPSGHVEGTPAWAYATLESDTARVAIAELSGASMLFVNGTPYVGDAYGYSSAGVPIALRQGTNDVYVTGIRDAFSLRLREQADPLRVVAREATLPNATSGLGSVLAMNATERPIQLVKPCKIRLAPLQATNVPFEFDLGTGPGGLKVSFVTADSERPLTATLNVGVRNRSEAHGETFRSTIDGSVQSYAVLPPSEAKAPESGHGLVLTLHGARPSAMNHLSMYSAKPDFWLVAPSNRRVSGFEWQDWDRLDAYEALEHALAVSGVRKDRVYLSGFSMGGHGAWSLAVNDPDRFGAIAPSAGWITYDPPGDGRPEGSLADVWRRADGASRTLELLSNLTHTPIYILHGSADEVVPVAEARDAMKALGEPLADFRTLCVREGSGHQWDGSESEGVDCVDWPPIFELFRRRRSTDPATKEEIDWVSVDPVVDARHEWVLVDQVLEYGRPFRLKGRCERERVHIALDTTNVRRLRIDAPGFGKGSRLTLDGREISPSSTGWYLRSEEGWRPDETGPSPSEKSPTRSGPFKRSFDREFVFVIGTRGDEVEDRELLELARYEANVWWYRANGTVRMFTDVEFLADAVHAETRNVIFFGNEDTNAAWKAVIPSNCPVRAKRGSITLREEKHEGADLACLFVYPRADVAALVGAFADSGPRGTRLLATVPVFVPGVGLPDFTLFGSSVLERGDDGVLAAGWFDFAWR